MDGHPVTLGNSTFERPGTTFGLVGDRLRLRTPEGCWCWPAPLHAWITGPRRDGDGYYLLVGDERVDGERLA